MRYGLVSGKRLRLYEGSPFSGRHGRANRPRPLNQVRLLAPCRPSKVVAVGLNYKAHAKEVKKELPAEPMIFLKPSTSVIGPGEKNRAPGHQPAGGPRVRAGRGRSASQCHLGLESR